MGCDERLGIVSGIGEEDIDRKASAVNHPTELKRFVSEAQHHELQATDCDAVILPVFDINPLGCQCRARLSPKGIYAMRLHEGI